MACQFTLGDLTQGIIEGELKEGPFPVVEHGLKNPPSASHKKAPDVLRSLHLLPQETLHLLAFFELRYFLELIEDDETLGLLRTDVFGNAMRSQFVTSWQRLFHG
jgi:hypothetical protein